MIVIRGAIGALRTLVARQSRSATVTSISTGPRRGSAATPIAERVWRPAAPNTSTSRRLAPSTTVGCSAKSPVQATNPVTVRTRATRSRVPSSARSSDRALRAHHAAHSTPTWVATSRPSSPVACSTPSALRGRQPEVRAVPPCTTTASSGSWGGKGPGSVNPSPASRASYDMNVRLGGTAQPPVEEPVGAVAVPPVAAVEDVVLQAVGRAERGVDRREARHLPAGRVDREDEVVGAGLDEQRPRRHERAEADVVELAQHAGEHLRAAQVPRDAVRGPPFVEVTADDRGADARVRRRDEQ